MRKHCIIQVSTFFLYYLCKNLHCIAQILHSRINSCICSQHSCVMLCLGKGGGGEKKKDETGVSVYFMVNHSIVCSSSTGDTIQLEGKKSQQYSVKFMQHFLQKHN